jgi:hypothetical protein
LEEVGVSFLWAGACGASIIKLAILLLVHYLSGWQKAHAEFEYEFALLEAGLVGKGQTPVSHKTSPTGGPTQWVGCSLRLKVPKTMLFSCHCS